MDGFNSGVEGGDNMAAGNFDAEKWRSYSPQ